MALDEGAEPLPSAATRAGAETRAPRRPALVHRGALLLTAATLVLAVVLGYRLLTDRPPTYQLSHSIPFLLALLGTAFFGAVALFRPERGEVRGLIWTAASSSLALSIALGAVWVLAGASVREDHWVGTAVESPAAVEAFLADHLPPAGDDDPAPWLVPTGVMIQSLEFLNANNVQVAGYVWQKYEPAIPADITRGVILPEAVEEAYQLVEAYRVDQGGTELVGWYFAAVLRQAFDYRDYPFDRQDVWIRLWHRDFDRRVLLVPDFAAYQDLDPRSLPGIERQFVYGGWQPEDAGFSYALNHYDTSFGLGPAAPTSSFPELYFNFSLKRSFTGPFFDHIVFAVAVALLLFLVLVLTTSEDELQGRFGLSTAGVLGACSGLLFAVILKHNDIRRAIAVDQITYLETLPFLLAVFIVLVALNAILLASPLQIRLIEHRHNLRPVLLYWPLLLGLLLAASLIILPLLW